MLRGHPWLISPVFVVEDSDDALIVYTPEHAPFVFPPLPPEFLPHPWNAAGKTAWAGHGKLSLQRPADAYSIDVFWRGPERLCSGWYVNLQDPVRRLTDGFETLDHELDCWVSLDGAVSEKDVDLFEQRIAEGRYPEPLEGEIRRIFAALKETLPVEGVWCDSSWARWTPPTDWTVHFAAPS